MLPVALVSLVLTCGLLLARQLPSPTGLALLVAVTVVLGVWFGGVRGLVCALLLAIVLWRVVAVAAATREGRWPEGLTGTDLTVEGSVCEFARTQDGATRFVLETHAAQSPAPLPPRVLVTWYGQAAAPAPGQTWRLRLRLRPPRGLANPAGFDFERWLFAQRVGATAWVKEDPANEHLADRPAPCMLGSLRAVLAERIAAALPGQAAASYVLGLTVGAYQALPESEWENLRRTGTVHLVSISGFHLALVAAPGALIGLWMARWLLAVGIGVRPRVWAAWWGALAGTAYGMLAGFTVPTARSVLMLVVVAGLASLRRFPGPAWLLGAVLVGLLLLDPLAPLVPGFWLSFAGVMVLVFAVERWLREVRDVQAMGLWRLAGLGWRGLRSLLVSQLLITIALAPLLVLFFNQLPVVGTLANLVAVPAFSLVLVPLSLLGAAVVAISPAAAVPILALAADCADWWRQFIAWCADLPVATWSFAAPEPAGVALALAGVVACLWPSPWPGRTLGVLCLGALLGSSSPRVPDGGLRVTVMDVGQGLSVLLETANHAMLYDAGPAYRGSDAGRRVVVPVLQGTGIRRLDLLMISHADADHRGGAGSVLDTHAEALVLGSPPEGRPGQPCVAGMAWSWDGVGFSLLHPPGEPGLAVADNDTSCVLLVQTAGASVLLPGDIGARVEEELVSKGAIAPVDLVVAAHHGSRTSSSERLVRATAPRYVVFSTGFANRWHFPAVTVVGRWRGEGACLLDTARDGAVEFIAVPGQALQPNRRQRAAAPGIWLARSALPPDCP